MVHTQKLTTLQLELVKLFSYKIAENQVLEIKQLLSTYFANKATEEMDKLWEENNWSEETMKDWSNEHFYVVSDSQI